MAPTSTAIDEAEKAMADTLIATVLEIIVGRGFWPKWSLATLEYGRVKKYSVDEQLDAIRSALDEMQSTISAELDTDLREPWNSRGDEIWDKLWASLLDKLQKSIQDLSRNILKTFVSCSEEDIKDRSKRDWLAKTFALAQTTWFVVQCIARRAQHLPLTKIELMTCAYAVLSAVIFGFWWHKPFGVQFPIIVHTEIPHMEKQEMNKVEPDLQNIDTLADTLAYFLKGNTYDEIDLRCQLRVPTFYSGDLNSINGALGFYVEIVIAAVFGGIHLFAWNYEFPTQIELWLWRVSALVIVGFPPIVIILIRRMHLSISKISLPILVLLYITARLFLLVLSLISLRKLPVGTLINVDWLTFIPHID